MHIYPDLTPQFTHQDGFYYTLFGPVFYHSDLHFPGSGALESRAGLTSLLQTRKPEIHGFHDRLFDNQPRTIRRLRTPLHKLMCHLRDHYKEIDLDLLHMQWLTQPHVKRRLRISAHAEYIDKGLEPDDRGYVQFKLKNGETLPAGKKRGIVDIGLLRTNLTGFIIDGLKDAFANPFRFGDCTYRFYKTADRGDISGLFRTLVDSDENIFAFHGDDSVGRYRCVDGFVYFNADISKCDGSHGVALVRKLHKLLRRVLAGTSQEPYLDYSFELLNRALLYSNPKDSKQKVQYEFSNPRLYSGSVLTTIMNSFANLLIGLNFNGTVVTKQQFRETFIAKAEEAGYIVTVTMCNQPEDLQFLKMSPICDVHGEYHAVNNLGSCLKNFGLIPGDLPGRGQIEDRARKHVFGVVQGRVDWGNHAVARAFVVCVERMMRVEHRVDILNTTILLDDLSLCRRYGCTPDEMYDLCHLIARSDLGYIVHHHLIDVIYNIDYG